MAQVTTRVVRAEVVLSPGTDDAALGAAVTVALCGHWEHDGPCRWPHHNALVAEVSPARFRTVVVCNDADDREVRRRIESALLGGDAWRVLSVAAGAPSETEAALGERLARGAA